MEPEREIYLDNSATTKSTPEVNAAMLDALEHCYGNPSSLHRLGMQAEKAFGAAKRTVAGLLGVTEGEVYITSGGTESSNLAILGAAEANKRRGSHIICTGVEHPAVYETVKSLASRGFEAEFLGVDETGRISLEEFEALLRPDTILACVMHVNNETGAVMPVEALKPVMKKKSPHALLFADAVQSFGKIAVKPAKWGVDLLSASAHKIHGPKGVGALYVKKGTRIVPVQFGGHQQGGLRSGTENVPGAVGFGAAAALAQQHMKARYAHVRELNHRLRVGIESNIDNVVFNSGDKDGESLPYILNVSFLGIKAEILLHALESKGIYVSTGSACSSNAPAPSRTLLAMGKSKKEVEGAVRFSFSGENTAEEIDYTLETLAHEVAEIRKYVRG